MSKKLLVSLFAFFCLIKTISALSVVVPGGETECFYEELETGEKIAITYIVAQADDYNIDFKVLNPQNNVLLTGIQKERGSHLLTANTPGRYTYCFTNTASESYDKVVSFNAKKNEKIENATNDADPLRLEIEELADSIFDVKAQQEYLVARERRHRDTVESTNERVKWWSISQIVLLIGVCLWQVHYLKHFFSSKRKV